MTDATPAIVPEDPNRKQEFAASFDRAADVYERARPTYPDAFVAWVMSDRPKAIADVGAGTGKLTRLLVPDADTVYAIDPSERMLEQLRAAAPGVDARVGTAESMPLDDASVDVVTCAQAWHWVDPVTAVPEIRRVLKPGGALVLVWNERDARVPWVAELTEAMQKSNGELWLDDPQLPDGEVERFEHDWSMPFTRETLHELVASRSYVITATDDEKAAIRERVDAVLDRVLEDDPYAEGVMPYVTHGFRIRF